MISRNKKGIALALVALLIPVILAYGAYVVDLSQAYAVNSRIRNAVDLASLAGISQLQDEDNVSDAKNTALSVLNSNLSQTVMGFTALTLSSSSLTLQVGIYDFNGRTFTWDEASSSVNALKIAYSYNSMTNFTPSFITSSIMLTGNAIAAKQPAGYMPPGTGFPLVIGANSMALCSAMTSMITLDQAMSSNSWWTAFDSMGGTSQVLDILWYWMYGSGSGTQPSGLTVGEEFTRHLGSNANIYSNINPSLLEGNTYIFPVGTDTGGNMIRTDAFVGATVDDVDVVNEEIDITIIPGYIVNTYGGAKVSNSSNNSAICSSGGSYLSYAYTLVQ